MNAAKAKGTLAGWVGVAAVGLMVAGPLLTGWQCYRWIRVGTWPPVSVITALQWAEGPGRITWASWPTDWLGLHKLLEQIPLSLVLFVAGVCVFWIVVNVFESRRPQPRSPT